MRMLKTTVISNERAAARHVADGATISAVGFPLWGKLSKARMFFWTRSPDKGPLLDGLFARVREAIVLLDTDDRVLQVNPEFTRVFGYAQEEACGRRSKELI